MISGWLKKPIIFLGLSMFISYGVMDMAIAQSPGRQSTSNIRINDLHFRIQTSGITQLQISSSTTSQNGVGMTCVKLSFDGKAGQFCEDVNSDAHYVCQVSRDGNIAGSCTCTGVCDGFETGCETFGGTVNGGGTCNF
jgi:hypothetical protein